MEYQQLLDNQRETRHLGMRATILKSLIGLALCGCVATLALGNDYSTSMKDTISTWLLEPKDNYNWNVTSVLSWNTVNSFSDVSVAPNGNLFAI